MIYEIWLTTKGGGFSENIYDLTDKKDEHIVLEPHLRSVINEPGSFSFILPPGNVGYDQIEIRTSTIDVVENGTIIWTGRPIEFKYDFQNNLAVTCEGALGYLKDAVLPRVVYQKVNLHQFFLAILDGYNRAIDAPEQRKLYLGEHKGTVSASTFYRKVNYETAWECVQDMILNAEGGWLVLRKPYVGNCGVIIDYIRDFEEIDPSSQRIEFTENMLDYNFGYSYGEVVTAVMPICEHNEQVYTLDGFDKEEDYEEITINGTTYRFGVDVSYCNGAFKQTLDQGYSPGAKTVNGHVVITDDELIQKYGLRVETLECELVKDLEDLSSYEEDLTSLSTDDINAYTTGRMHNRATVLDSKRVWYEEACDAMLKHMDEFKPTITVKAADLRNLPNPPDVDNIRLGDKIIVYSHAHELFDGGLPVTEIDIYLNKGAKTVTLGNPEPRKLTKIYPPKERQKVKKRARRIARYHTSTTGRNERTYDTESETPSGTPSKAFVTGLSFTWADPTTHHVGDVLSRSDYEVSLTYSDGHTKVVTERCTYNLGPGGRLTGYKCTGYDPSLISAFYTVDGKEWIATCPLKVVK